MCTVSWVHEGGGYQLFCNRDEKLTRQRADPPRLATRDGVRFLAPTDRDFGGTWIGANEFGVSICLLNGASQEVPRKKLTSRGLLMRDLVVASSIADLWQRIGERDLPAFAPFTLAALERGHPAAVIKWSGAGRIILTRGDAELPLTSSSFDAEGVRTRRRQEYLRLLSLRRPDERTLLAFHESHGARAGGHSTCMHRPDAETVSFSWIKVTDSAAKFFYTPAAPCRWVPGETTSLALCL